MTSLPSPLRSRRTLLLAANIAVRAAIVFWLAEAWVMQDDPRFADKAIAERNTVIVLSLSMLLPAIWWFRGLEWSRYPLGLDILYLGIFALDMAGNSFDLYDSYEFFDLIPHFHSTGAMAVVIGVYWARTRHSEAPDRGRRRWLLETTLVAAGVATMVHVALEIQEYYTDLLAGTLNVGGVADTVNDLLVGLIAAIIYPPLFVRWFLDRSRPARVHATIAITAIVVFLLVSSLVFLDAGARFADFVGDTFATDLDSGGITEAQRQALLAAALAGAGTRSVTGVEEIRHAHDGGTFDEMMGALTGGYQSVEGDVGLVGEVAVMRHDPRDPVGMRFREWLEIVAVAEFGIVKVDLKRDKVGPIIDELHAGIRDFGLREERLKINADVLDGPGAYKDFDAGERLYTRLVLKLEPEDLIEMARAFPRATVSISAWTGPVEAGRTYDQGDIEGMLDVAERVREAGSERVVVAARWDLLSDEFIDAMAAAGVVIDVWNSLTVAASRIDDAAAEVARLRERAPEAFGVIDLRAQED